MSYQKEWLLLEANDEVDEMEHRDPSEEYQFYRAVADGDVNAVRHNCELGRFREGEGVGQLSRDPVMNLKYHFVITTAMVTRLCGQHGMELEQAFRLSDFYIQKLDDLHTEDEVCALHDEMVMDYTKKMRKNLRSDTNSKHINASKDYIYAISRSASRSRIWLMNWGCPPVICPGCSKRRPACRCRPTSASKRSRWPKTCCGSATVP